MSNIRTYLTPANVIVLLMAILAFLNLTVLTTGLSPFSHEEFGLYETGMDLGLYMKLHGLIHPFPKFLTGVVYSILGFETILAAKVLAGIITAAYIASIAFVTLRFIEGDAGKIVFAAIMFIVARNYHVQFLFQWTVYQYSLAFLFSLWLFYYAWVLPSRPLNIRTLAFIAVISVLAPLSHIGTSIAVVALVPASYVVHVFMTDDRWSFYRIRAFIVRIAPITMLMVVAVLLYLFWDFARANSDAPWYQKHYFFSSPYPHTLDGFYLYLKWSFEKILRTMMFTDGRLMLREAGIVLLIVGMVRTFTANDRFRTWTLVCLVSMYLVLLVLAVLSIHPLSGIRYSTFMYFPMMLMFGYGVADIAEWISRRTGRIGSFARLGVLALLLLGMLNYTATHTKANAAKAARAAKARALLTDTYDVALHYPTFVSILKLYSPDVPDGRIVTTAFNKGHALYDADMERSSIEMLENLPRSARDSLLTVTYNGSPQDANVYPILAGYFNAHYRQVRGVMVNPPQQGRIYVMEWELK